MTCPNLLNSCQPGGRRSTSIVVALDGGSLDGAPVEEQCCSVVGLGEGLLANMRSKMLKKYFFRVDAAAPDDVVAAGVVSGVDSSSSSGSRSSNMNSISSETLSSMTWGSMKTMCERMSRK